MQKESTLKFWDDFHETEGAKEWIVHPTAELFDLIYAECSSVREDGRFQVLEIGCGTSTMAREFWKYISGIKNERDFHVRSTDVSQVCVDACFARDKDLTNVSDQGGTVAGGCGLNYTTLNVLETPVEAERGAWSVILDKACLDTFMFRSRHRGLKKAYPELVQTALDNIWTLMAPGGVYMLMSPRTKLKAVRDYVGFSSVERRAVQSEEKGGKICSKNNTTRKERDEACYMYICRKNLNYVVGKTTAFRENYRSLPMDEEQCPACGLLFGVFRNGEDADGRGVVFWSREWQNHCIHCKAPVDSVTG